MIDVARSVLALTIVLVAHLVEEARKDFRRHFPQGEMPRPLLIGVNLSLYLFCLTTLALALAVHEHALPLARIFGLAMFVIGGVHIGMMIYRRAYFPGGYTALGLVAEALWLMWVLKG